MKISTNTAMPKSAAITDDLEIRWAKIEARMIANARWLSRQGVLIQETTNRGTVWYLRFRSRDHGVAVHRRIVIGNERDVELRRRVLRLLHNLHEESRWASGLHGAVAAVAGLRWLCHRCGLARTPDAKAPAGPKRSGARLGP